MFPILIALLVFAAIGLAATWWLRRPHGPAPGTQAAERGASQLGALRWREFARLVLQAMHARGYRTVFDGDTPPDGIPSDGSDILLERDGTLTLLSCRYGSASVVGVQALLGLAKSAKLRGAHKVLVVTPGRFEQEAARLAVQQDIELIDGEDLWPEVRPYVARPAGEEQPEPTPPAGHPKAVGIAWGAAALAGALVWMLANGMGNDAPTTDASATAATAAATARKSARSRPAKPAMAEAAATAGSDAIVPSDPAELEKRRRETANAISTLPGVDRALWSTQSTLLVHLASEEADPVDALCPLLERYPELAASRVQLQPPQGSDRPVRFKQCRTY